MNLLQQHLADLEALAAAKAAARQARESEAARIRAQVEEENAREQAAIDDRNRETQRRQLLFLRKYYPAQYLAELAKLKAEQEQNQNVT